MALGLHWGKGVGLVFVCYVNFCTQTRKTRLNWGERYAQRRCHSRGAASDNWSVRCPQRLPEPASFAEPNSTPPNCKWIDGRDWLWLMACGDLCIAKMERQDEEFAELVPERGEGWA